MTSRPIPILLLALAALASCAPAAERAGCAGWRPIRVAEPTLEWLAAHDLQTLAALTAHLEQGKRMGCGW